MTATWPVGLPWDASSNDFSDTMETNKAVFKTELGNPKARKRYSSSSDTIQFSMRLSTMTEVYAFKEFYRDTLKDGVLPFENTHPAYGDHDATTYNWTFMGEAPVVTSFGAIFSVTLTLRKSV